MIKITASDIRFNTVQEQQSTETFSARRSNSGPTETGQSAAQFNVIDLSYTAKMRAEDSSLVQATSTVKSGYNQATYQQTQATHALTQTTLGINAFIQNVSLDTNSSPLLAAPQNQTYQSIEQLNLSSGTPDTTSARVEVKEQYSFTQNQTLHVGTQGRVTTEDGTEIDFMLQLEMNRNFSMEESLHLTSTQRQLIDPLVINLAGGTASLTSQSFSFDLNADGHEEQISFVGPGSGFLAIDRNEDGRINDGSELFGTGSKSAFADLAQYDQDNNKWIDENDPIFSKLKVWTRDAEGHDQLISLKAAGVGAIYLGAALGDFDLRDAENNLLGQIKRSGIYLTEKGQVASIQELDIAIRDAPQTSSHHANNIELQIGAWNSQRPAADTQRIHLDSNIASTPFMMEEEEEEQRSLIDWLFPVPGSQYDYSAKIHRSTQTVTATNTVTNQSVIDTQAPVPSTIRLQNSSFQALQQLESKTAVKLEAEQDKYSHLKAIIESLHQQRIRHQQQETP